MKPFSGFFKYLASVFEVLIIFCGAYIVMMLVRDEYDKKILQIITIIFLSSTFCRMLIFFTRDE